MSNGGKRGTLSSALLKVARNPLVTHESMPETAPAGPSVDEARSPAVGEPSRDREHAVQPQSASGILFSKGAASAAAFRPSHWSYEQHEKSPPPANTEFAAPPSDDAADRLATPVKAGVKPRLWLAVALCCCLALIFPGLIFILSQSRHADDVSVAQPPAIAGQTRPPAAAQDAANLLARGDTFLGTGDIVSARLYYEQAAKAGNGRAAMLMGATFDPVFLGRVGARGLRGDLVQAVAWYRRARELGEAAAAPLLTALDSQ